VSWLQHTGPKPWLPRGDRALTILCRDTTEAPSTHAPAEPAAEATEEKAAEPKVETKAAEAAAEVKAEGTEQSAAAEAEEKKAE
jgi:hypothetical protein